MGLKEYILPDNREFFGENPQLVEVISVHRDYRSLGGVGLLDFTSYLSERVSAAKVTSGKL